MTTTAQPVRQEIHWIDQSRRLTLETKPYRVWSLFAANKPELPVVPKHNGNAFLEDYIHDWNYDPKTNTFRYYSRVALDKVWVLLEYKN